MTYQASSIGAFSRAAEATFEGMLTPVSEATESDPPPSDRVNQSSTEVRTEEKKQEGGGCAKVFSSIFQIVSAVVAVIAPPLAPMMSAVAKAFAPPPQPQGDSRNEPVDIDAIETNQRSRAEIEEKKLRSSLSLNELASKSVMKLEGSPPYGNPAFPYVDPVAKEAAMDLENFPLDEYPTSPGNRYMSPASTEWFRQNRVEVH